MDDTYWWQSLNSEAEQWEAEYLKRISTGKHGVKTETPNGLPTIPDTQRPNGQEKAA